MKTLRLPWSVSPASLRSARDTPSCLARSLTPAAKLSLGCRDVVEPVSPCFWQCRRGDRRISQVPREPMRTSALLLDPGRTLARGFWRSGAAPVGIKTKAPAIGMFRGSITQLLCSLHTLEAVLSGDSPMLASGWLPPFPGGAFSFPTGFLQRISTLISSLFPFFLDFPWRYMPASTLTLRRCAGHKDSAPRFTPPWSAQIFYGPSFWNVSRLKREG
jgi:hypothetical protein